MVTIKEIAKAVGVSSATVSRVLNYDQTLSISAQKRQAIIETAEALDYATPRNRNKPPHAPQMAPTPPLAKIALVKFYGPAEELADPYYIGVRFGIEMRCQALRIDVVKVYEAASLDDASVLRAASGVIVVGRHSVQELNWLRQINTNIVLTDMRPTVDEYDFVESDLRQAMRLVLDRLAGAGYTRIAYIGGKERDAAINRFTEKRCAAYLEWMKDRGLYNPDLCRIDRLMFESGYELTQELLDLEQPPEVIITGNDNMAIGAYRAIQEKGLSIPADIGVIGFNDIPAAQFLAPPLSTVKIYAERVGETAVDLLMEQINGREFTKKVSLTTEIIWRESCRLPS